MILLVDNYDSFVHNLARHLQRLGQETLVVRNDAIDASAVRRLRPAALVLSPGPCAPDQAGASLDLVCQLHTELPLLGVCLGHQAIAQALGGRIIRAPAAMHGRASLVRHKGEGLFAGLPNPLRAGRYHSLCVEPTSLPPQLEVTAWTDDAVIMALAHRTLPVVGWQFHPESILTECGYLLLAAFLRLAGISVPPHSVPRSEDELAPPPVDAPALSGSPVTF